MHFPAILREIDFEIDRLTRARNILAELAGSSVTKMNKAAKTLEQKPQSAIPVPVLKVLPPKQRRTYQRRVKPHVPEPRALAAPRSDKPVVYTPPKPENGETSSPPIVAPQSLNVLEAAIRHNLIGRAV